MWNYWLKINIIGACLLGMAFVSVGLLGVVPAQAEGGLAISGSFYQQVFEIPQGSSVSGPSINVVVFNNSNEKLNIKMTSNSPLGVHILLSQSGFALLPGGQQEVLVGVEVTQDAAPGDYNLSIVAESSKEGISGIQLAGAAAQRATLKVLGESSLITLASVSPDGQPVVAMVRLFRVVAGQNLEVAYSGTGTLEAKVAPGSFVATSYVGGEKLAEQSFSVVTNDKKKITLSGATVYFEGFGVMPNYQKKGGDLAFAQLVYTVNNLYQRATKSEVILEVSRNESPLEEISLVTLSPLEMGRVGLNYNYIPAGGWVDGSYSFKLQLNLNDKPYTTSPVQQLKVGSGGVSGGGISYFVIGGIAAVVVVAAVVGWLFIRKRRRV